MPGKRAPLGVVQRAGKQAFPGLLLLPYVMARVGGGARQQRD